MHVKEYPDWHDVVAAHWRQTTGFVLALSGPCLQIRDEELEAIRENRVLVGLSLDDLASWKPPASWFLAVLLCSDDSVGPLVSWVAKHKIDIERIKFYAHRDTDPWKALQPWAKADLGDPAVDEGITTWRRFHRQFGVDLAIRILEDWG